MEEILFLISLMKMKGFGPVKINQLVEHIKARAPLRDLTQKPEYLQKFFPNFNVKEFSKNKEIIKEQLDVIFKHGWNCLLITSEKYPEPLKHYLKYSAPPVLFYKGNLTLLKHKIVGFCGSRKPSNTGLKVAQDCAYYLVKKNIVTISGYAAGIDQQVHKSSLEIGGKTIIVLPTGALEFSVRRQMRDLWDWNKVLVLSQFLPDAKWSIGNAMTRNKTIVSLSSSVIFVESKGKGGSIDAGLTALKMGKPLFVPIYKNMSDFALGNKMLITKGALPLNKRRIYEI